MVQVPIYKLEELRYFKGIHRYCDVMFVCAGSSYQQVFRVLVRHVPIDVELVFEPLIERVLAG